jgi:hypothetical protein
MAIAAPVVIAGRLTRLAVAGPAPGPRERSELIRMGQEKIDASVESTWATAMGMVSTNQRLCRVWASSARSGKPPKIAEVSATLLASWFQIVERSVVPYHRRVISNARRLSK